MRNFYFKTFDKVKTYFLLFLIFSQQKSRKVKTVIPIYVTTKGVLKQPFRQDSQLSSPKKACIGKEVPHWGKFEKLPNSFYSSGMYQSLTCYKNAFWYLKCCCCVILCPSCLVSNKSITSLCSLMFWSFKKCLRDTQLSIASPFLMISHLGAHPVKADLTFLAGRLETGWLE